MLNILIYSIHTIFCNLEKACQLWNPAFIQALNRLLYHVKLPVNIIIIIIYYNIFVIEK